MLLGELSSSQLEEWKAYAALEPLLDVERIEWALANIARLIVNISQSIHSKNPKTCKVEDFLPFWDPDTLPKEKKGKSYSTPEEIKNLFLTAFKVRDKRKGKEPKKSKGPRKKEK